MKDIIQLDENNRCVSANCNYTEEDKTVEYEFDNEEERMSFFDNLQDYVYQDGKFVLDEQPSTENKKAEQEAQLQKMMLANARATFLIELPDEEAVKIPYCYDEWVSNHDYKVGDRCQDGGKLWKCRQEHTSQEDWRPLTKTASLWEVIEEQHEGTIDDPIPYDMNMEVFKDKYYIENDVVYKCIRDSGQPLYASCSSLLGNYFELVL